MIITSVKYQQTGSTTAVPAAGGPKVARVHSTLAASCALQRCCAAARQVRLAKCQQTGSSTCAAAAAVLAEMRYSKCKVDGNATRFAVLMATPVAAMLKCQPHQNRASSVETALHDRARNASVQAMQMHWQWQNNTHTLGDTYPSTPRARPASKANETQVSAAVAVQAVSWGGQITQGSVPKTP